MGNCDICSLVISWFTSAVSVCSIGADVVTVTVCVVPAGCSAASMRTWRLMLTVTFSCL
jgi:hypothetical protein